MNIPSKVKVGGLTYDVSIDKNLRDAAGETDNQTLTIKIGEAKQEAMELTFFHELFHAMNFEVGEKDVEFYAMSFYQILKDNPIIFRGGGKKHGK